MGIHYQTQKMINSGKIIKQNKCENCGKEGKIHCHHNTVNDPEDINFLCVLCHKQVHCQPNGNIRFDRQHRIKQKAQHSAWKILFDIRKHDLSNWPKIYWQNFINPPKPEIIKKYFIIVMDSKEKVIHKTTVSQFILEDELADALNIPPAYFLQ